MRLIRFLPLLALLALAVKPLRAESDDATAEQIRALFHMKLIPDEGAYFCLTYQSPDVLQGAALPGRYRHGATPAADRPIGSAIYCLVTREHFSALHRLETDEIWHYYSGAPLEMLLLRPDGTGEIAVLGPGVLHGERPQIVVTHGTWMGALPRGAYTFFGTTLAPAFAYEDFTLGHRAELQQAYPKFATAIRARTRE